MRRHRCTHLALLPVLALVTLLGACSNHRPPARVEARRGIAIASPTSPAPPKTAGDAPSALGSIAIKLVDQAGEPKAYTQVNVTAEVGSSRFNDLTEADGTVRFKGLPAGAYTIEAFEEGVPFERLEHVTVTPGSSHAYTIHSLASTAVRESKVVHSTVYLQDLLSVAGGGSGSMEGVSGGSMGGYIGASSPSFNLVTGGLAASLESPASRDSYAYRSDNGFLRVADAPLSTFSSDVDTASYSNVRRFIAEGSLPPRDAVRVEEMLNYFRYDDPLPDGGAPFGVRLEAAACPWAPAHRLVRIGLRTAPIDDRDVPPRTIVFLVDVSGSMMSSDKLPLVKAGLTLLGDQLDADDRIAIVAYAGQAGLVLPLTSGGDHAAIRGAIARLEAGGSTNGGAGIKLAYDLAERHLRPGGLTRVVLATDGDFNVGVTSEGELVQLVEEERAKGVFLTVLGFGRGNLRDSTMELLADKGNGNYGYVDTLDEARKLLIREGGATLVTVAKDVKLQVEFNPSRASGYRLVGYEDRLLADRDFNDDHVDAGDLGAGHAVTALYEVVPAEEAMDAPTVDALRYQEARRTTNAARSGAELLTLKVRWKAPDGDESQLLSRTLEDDDRPIASASSDLRFAAGVAEFGMLLRASPGSDAISWTQAKELVATGDADGEGLRRELGGLIVNAEALASSRVASGAAPR